MGIEKDIQQAKFRNAHQKAGINLIYTPVSYTHLDVYKRQV